MAGNLDFSLFIFSFFHSFIFPKLIQLLEAVSVDDFSQLAVVVVMNGGSCAAQFQ